MSKRVRVAVDVSESFVKMLQAKCQMKGWLSGDLGHELDVGGVLLVALLGEMRGAYEHEIHFMIPNKWRPDVEVVHALRCVKVDGRTAIPGLEDGAPADVVTLVADLKKRLTMPNMRYVIEELVAELAGP